MKENTIWWLLLALGVVITVTVMIIPGVQVVPGLIGGFLIGFSVMRLVLHKAGW